MRTPKAMKRELMYPQTALTGIILIFTERTAGPIKGPAVFDIHEQKDALFSEPEYFRRYWKLSDYHSIFSVRLLKEFPRHRQLS